MRRLINLNNPIIKSDSYKVSQWLQYPPETTEVWDYVESRGGKEFAVTYAGFQPMLEFLEKGITRRDIAEAHEFMKKHYNGIFNKQGWDLLIERYNGKFPIEIKAVPEGTTVPTGNVLVTIRNTDPDFYWLPGYLETMILRAIWYPTTVATYSRKAQKVIRRYLLDTEGTDAGWEFKLHDFGARGASSGETAALGGMAHMLVGFMGSDTMEGVQYANYYYDSEMSGFSIPASEHSTITTWGVDFEIDAYRNMIEQFGKPEAIYACVSDSYNIWEALEKWKELEPVILEKGGTLVVRPDSGDPVFTPVHVVQKLMDLFGYSINSAGFKVLPDHIRVIQGDGIDVKDIENILEVLKMDGISANNIAFGMGGNLLQNHTRDSQKFALKASFAEINGKGVLVQKNPVGQPDKASKAGKLMLYKDRNGEFYTADLEAGSSDEEMLETVFLNGKIVKRYTLEEVRARASE